MLLGCFFQEGRTSFEASGFLIWDISAFSMLNNGVPNGARRRGVASHSLKYKLSKNPYFPKSDKCNWSKIRGNWFGTAFGEGGGVGGEISNYNGVGSQIYMSPHAPSYKLSKKLSFSKIGPVQVVQNHGELIRNSFCRLTQKVPPNFRPLTLVRFWKMRAFWKAYTLGSAAS